MRELFAKLLFSLGIFVSLASTSAHAVYTHLEDFDDHALNTPGVSGTGGVTTSFGFNGAIIDQAFQEGGCPPGGAAVACDTWFSSNGTAGVTFTFDAIVLGHLPDNVDITWTDGGFGAIPAWDVFVSGGILFETIFGGPGDNSNFGTASEDQTFQLVLSDTEAITTGGIESIRVYNSTGGGGIEVDELGYRCTFSFCNDDGNGGGTPVPEPSTITMLVLGLLGLRTVGRRKRV